ncbi:TRAP transporter large permease [Cytobacillus horneckiae]|uniref:TRAP transporter large permease n=1 Tax=Cytobacillus horneckiae TaxID=549687 RepID=UPI00203B5570|nr:TRAP transporter large permease [Cytobacillus horneckiae]MCM3177908.1 TRAP transporter large permease [Cytobacillus horneckiae]MEC1157285.1 TRAP transporter large permease [Cytobacillus horneckiae]MED2935834.1 TRAP transporter large permease [Cytobacillus horneckiae]
MSVEIIGLLGILLMFILMFLKVPIAISMVVPAIFGIIYLKGWNTLAAAVETITWDHSFSYTLSTIPMFVLMGELLYICGISTELFNTFRLWLSRLKGGLGMATIGSSAVFAAASGSSLANTATMGVIASKEMLNAGYNKSLTGGTIVAGGTLGVLIPPSTLFILYGMMTEQSIGQLLVAGIIPGIMLMGLYMLTVYIAVMIKPDLAPVINAKVTWKERFVSLKSTIWILLLFAIVIGGMYIGWFNPTEAAGIGAFCTFIIALLRKKLTVQLFIQALSSTLKTTGFLFAIIIMAFILNYFLTITRLPMVLADILNGLSLPPFLLFAIIILMYILLGMVMDALAMVVVTLPIILPLIHLMGLDLIWFGVIIVLVMEMAMITPPVGMNCFVLKGAAPDLSLEQIFKGAALFILPIIVLIVILYLFPNIALYLPSNMY